MCADPRGRAAPDGQAYAPLILAGPTASGKSALALALAQYWPIEIISVDSALVYRGMDIGTAKPTARELAQVPHHLIDILEPHQHYSAARFVQDATELIAQIQARGHCPLLVGGTMLYAKALREGLDDIPASDMQIRAQVQAEALRHGWPALHARLRTLDPSTAQRLPAHDAQRIGRALEVYMQTGRPLSSFHSQSGLDVSAQAQPALISLEPNERAWLHERIAQRFAAMLEQGLVDEVRRVYTQLSAGQGSASALTLDPANLPSMRCVGYRQVLDCMLGTSPWTSLAERGIAATRQLAKRQLTWLRGMQRQTIACDAPPQQVLSALCSAVQAHWPLAAENRAVGLLLCADNKGRSLHE